MDEYCAAWRRDLIGSAADLAELDALLAGPADEAVLHGDLHGGNVLLHQGAWVAIDPHAVYGDRNAEIWSLIDPLSPVLGGDSEMARVALSTFASAAELDPARAARWTRLRATAESEAINRSAEASDEERVWAEKMQRFAAALGS